MAGEVPDIEVLQELSFLQRNRLAAVAEIVSEYTSAKLVFPPVKVHNYNVQSIYVAAEPTPQGITVNVMPRTAKPEELPDGSVKVEGGEEHIFDMKK